MSDSLWVSLSGALAQQKNVDTIANNVANANTPGFKKDQLVFKEHLTAFEKGTGDINLPRKEWAPKDFYKSHGSEHGFVKVDGTYTNFDQGQLTPSGNPFDLALQGKGFFEVLTPNGVRFTRKGSFSMSSGGALVTSDGYPILSKLKMPEVPEGTRVPASEDLDPLKRTILIKENGQISVNIQGDMILNGKKIAELSIVEFKDINALKKEGNSFYINQDEKNRDATTSKTAVHQGFVEESNVNAIAEMSELIKANRQFETIQRAMKAYDSMTGKSVNEIAKF